MSTAAAMRMCRAMRAKHKLDMDEAMSGAVEEALDRFAAAAVRDYRLSLDVCSYSQESVMYLMGETKMRELERVLDVVDSYVSRDTRYMVIEKILEEVPSGPEKRRLEKKYL